MDSRKLLAVLVLVILVGLVLLLWVLPSVEQRLSPELITAWIGIEVGDSGVAEVGRVRLAVGQPFRLHAILEAVTAGGDPLYYTEAAEVDFGEGVVAAEAVRRWDGSEEARILWLTLEGSAPYLKLPAGRGLDGFEFEGFFHPDWGRDWIAEGSVEARNADQLEGDWGPEGRQFGTQHYQAWIELFDDKRALVPKRRFKSPGWPELEADPDSFAAVALELEGALARPSRVFGLSQIELTDAGDSVAQQRLAELYTKRLAFSRLLLLRSLLEGSGPDEELDWGLVDLQAAEPFGDWIGPGDLLRVGARWVVLYRDAGRPGVLDPEDLCLDYDRGAEVRALSAVFVGGGDIEWASRASRPTEAGD